MNIDVLAVILNTLTVIGASEQAYKVFKHVTTAGERGMLEADRRSLEDWVRQSVAALDETLKDQRKRLDALEDRTDAYAEFEKRIEQRADRYDIWKVHRNYVIEAMREPTEERRTMLAHANASSFNLSLREGECARMERLLRELDPEDVRALRGLSMVTGGVVFDGKHYNDASVLTYVLWERSESADALVSSGCIRTTHRSGAGTGGTNEARVTRWGKLIVRGLRTYWASHPPLFEVPGREVLEGSRSQEEAWQMINGCGELRPLALHAANEVATRYDFPKWSQKDKTPPKASQKAVLRFHSLPTPMADSFNTFPSDPKTLDGDGASLCGRIAVRAVHMDGGAWSGEVHGPHDVLRYLADEIDAPWV